LQRPDPHGGLLYVSTLAADADIRDVGAIARTSRVHNQADGITGLLVFDGASFAQWVEGPCAAISALRKRLQADRRHIDMDVLHFGPTESPRRFPTWSLGYYYLADDDTDGIASLRGLSEKSARKAFDNLIKHVDVMAAAQAHPGQMT
jgi:hypothetical protein